MDEVIAGMVAAPPEAGEFERAQARLIAAHTYEQDSQYALANSYGQALVVGMTVEDVEDWPNRIAQVSPADVQNPAKNFLIRKEAVTGRVSPAAP